MDVAFDFYVRLFELGLSGNAQFRPLGHSVNSEVTGTLLVERKLVEMYGSIERWLFQGAGTIRGKIRAAGHGNARALQNRDTGKVKIVSGEVESKGVTGNIVGGAAGDIRFVVGQVNILEFTLFSVEIQVGTALFDRFAVNTAIPQQNVPLLLRGRSRSRHLQLQVHHPGDRVRVSGQGKNAGQIGILGLEVRLQGTGIGKPPLVKLHVEIKFNRVGVAAQRTVVHGEQRGRQLNVRPERIPANRLFWGIRCGRN